VAQKQLMTNKHLKGGKKHLQQPMNCDLTNKGERKLRVYVGPTTKTKEGKK